MEVILTIITISGACLSGLFEAFYGAKTIPCSIISTVMFTVNMLVLMGSFYTLMNSTNTWWKLSLISVLYFLITTLTPLITIIFNPWTLWFHLMIMIEVQVIIILLITFALRFDNCNRLISNAIL